MAISRRDLLIGGGAAAGGAIGAGAVTMTLARKLAQAPQDLDKNFEISARKFGAYGDGGNDHSGIQDALFEAASVGGGATVILPRPSSAAYLISEKLEIPTGVTLASVSRSVIIKPTAAMSSMVKVTGRFGGIKDVGLVNESGRAPVGVSLEFPGALNDNNFTTFQNILMAGFVRGAQTNGFDAFAFINIFCQNNDEWDFHADGGCLNAVIDGMYSLGSANNILLKSGSTTVEGVHLSKLRLLPTRGKGIVIRGALDLTIDQSTIDQCNDTGIELDGDNYPIADVHISKTWVGPRVGATNALIGIDIHGNVVDSTISRCMAVSYKTAGIRLKSTTGGAVQRVLIEGSTFRANGDDAGSADILVDTSLGGVSYTAKNNRMLSTGGSVKSVIEGNGAAGFLEGNRLASSTTKSPKSQWFDNYGDDLDPSTGKYVGWSAYTPSLTSSAGSLGAVTTSGRYKRDRGNTVHFEAVLQVTANGTGSGILITSVPLPCAKPTVFYGREDGLTGKAVQMYTSGDGQTLFGVADYNNGYPGGTGAKIIVSGSYECVA